MTSAAVTEPQADDVDAHGHMWVAATTVPVEPQRAGKAHRDGSMTLKETTIVAILEVYCEQCRRPYDDVADEPCIVPIEGNAHLRGGPIGVRRNRKCPIHRGPYADCKDQHEPEDHNYGRPPMPPLAVIAGWQ